MAENQNTKVTVEKATAIEFVNKFNNEVEKLMEILGVTRRIPMTVGDQIKTYKTVVGATDSNVEEGATIPLTKVEYKVDKTYELEYKKKRAEITAELIQRVGLEDALVRVDTNLTKEIQKDIRTDLLDFIKTPKQKAKVETLKGALAKAWGELKIAFGDDAIETVAFVNPLDISDHLEQNNLTLQTEFGLSYLKNFVGINTVIVTGLIPQGEVYATASDNIVQAYAKINGGELGKAFNLTTDKTGLIGIGHNDKLDNFTKESVFISGVKLFTERVDGNLKYVIEPKAEAEVGK